jgi:hypothetical protein
MAMYIDTLTHPQLEPAAVLEVFNTMGDSLDGVTVPLSAITSPTPDHVPAARRIERMTPLTKAVQSGMRWPVDVCYNRNH